MKVLLSGATGFVGRALALGLARRGHEIIALSRDPERAQREIPAPCRTLRWDFRAGPPEASAYEGVGAIVHLAGESVASGRWTAARKREILDSRVIGARNLLEGVPSGSTPAYISASAVGYYGDRGDEELTESSASGKGFLAEVCLAWEGEAQAHTSRVSRAVFLRTGVVLGTEGGALAKLVPLFRAGVGGPVGSGKQWVPWIHLDDLVAMFVAAIENAEWKGAYNAVAPEPARFGDLARLLGKTLHRPSFMPAPAPALKLALGEMSSALLGSQRARPERALAAGFEFRFAALESALADCLDIEAGGDSGFRAHQWIAAPVAQVFDFFSRAENLERITPPFVGFRITGQSDGAMGVGKLIDYRIKVHGIPLAWKTRIDQWTPNVRFADNQESGPYRKWYHVHTFEPLGGGTLIGDRVAYRLPLGWLGGLAAGSFVDKDVSRIFDYRRKAIGEFFPQPRP